MPHILRKTREYTRRVGNLALGFLRPWRPGNIAMFHMARSGSTVMGDLLDQHPSIFWDGEIYSPQRPFLFTRVSRSLISDPMKILQLRIRLAGTSFYGFETQFYHLDLINIELPDYIGQLKRLGFDHFILLDRRNHLRIIVSALIGLETDRWHQKRPTLPRLTQIELATDNVFPPNGLPLKATLSHFGECFAKLEKLLDDDQVLRLTYEDDILEDPLVGYRRVCRFLEVPAHEVTVRYGRTNPFKLKDMIINFSQVEEALCGTSFEWMLYE